MQEGAATMPSRAPTYYHWAMDKPCTTNQTYGFELKGEMTKYASLQALKPPKPSGRFDQVRPFSSLAFFPEIPDKRKSMTVGERHIKTAGVLDTKTPGVQSRFNINKGYTMGHVPVSSRVQCRKYPAEVQLISYQAVPQVYQHPKAKEKDIYLWHTLSGCLVHAKNPVNGSFNSQIAY